MTYTVSCTPSKSPTLHLFLVIGPDWEGGEGGEGRGGGRRKGRGEKEGVRGG